jgi:hypothetical protein
LIRAKTGKGAMKLPVLHRPTDGSFLSKPAGLPVRVIDAGVSFNPLRV